MLNVILNTLFFKYIYSFKIIFFKVKYPLFDESIYLTCVNILCVHLQKVITHRYINTIVLLLVKFG